jgi:hypoxanthine phosphoribosyltransferase
MKNDADDREILGWLEFGDAARHLASDVHGDDFAPDVVIAIARGGLLLAGAIAYALDVKSCGSLNVEFYTNEHTRLERPIVLPPLLDEPSLVGKKVLLVDDVSDSGRTLAMVVELLTTIADEVKTVVLYTKPGTVHIPDYSWRKTDRWIAFPWSTQRPVTAEIG